jgi:hypothetical protein
MFVSFALLLFSLPSVHAQDAAPTAAPPPHPGGLLHSVFASVVFGSTGIILAIIGFKLFDLVTPFNLEKEMCEHKNVAVGILCGAIVLGICHIIAASMS